MTDTLMPPDALVTVHAIAGATALLAPLPALLFKKGGLIHRLAGLLYVAAMLVLAVTAVPMSFFQWNSILLVILFLSCYMTLGAVMDVRRRRAKELARSPLRRKLAAVQILATGAITTLSLVWDPLSTALITAAFMYVSTVLATRDFTQAGLTRKVSEREWKGWHMLRMLGSYTLTVTVYSILNFESLDMVWRILLPILTGSALTTLCMFFYLRGTKSDAASETVPGTDGAKEKDGAK